MKGLHIGTVVAAAAVVVLFGAVLLLGREEPPLQTSIDAASVLRADTAGYARAGESYAFQFPEDHGPHPAFRTEWWYYTGNLTATGGRRFGYQLTIFRLASSPSAVERGDSTWSTRQLYMGHFALSDVQSAAFHAFERFSRGAAGLAGASASPYRVWLEDWSVAGPTADSVRVVAEENGTSVDLVLHRAKPTVLQGDEGLDRKGPEPGNASYYYSITRLRTSGTVTVGGQEIPVAGLSWMDREWSTNALGRDLAGWDWFSLQLDDERDVMFYRLRRGDGGTSPFSGGVVVGRDGTVARLSPDQVTLHPSHFWTSEASGGRYPVEWRFRVPSHSIDVELVPYLDDQELRHSVTYWEGAVRVQGSHGGSGYVELTGYGDADEPFAAR